MKWLKQSLSMAMIIIILLGLLPISASAASLKITTQPKTSYTSYGKKAKATVVASGKGLKYTWYVKNSNGNKYVKSSIKKATYSVKMTDATKNRKVYCVVKDKTGKSIKSRTVVLRMKATITKQPKTIYLKTGKTGKVIVKAKGDGLKYRWYIKNSGSSKYTKSSVKKSTYSVTMNAKTNGRRVYCVITDKYGKTAKTKTVVVKKKKITPQNVTFAKGKITTKSTTIKTKHLELHIDPNVYVPNDLAENLDIVTSAMEKVSGMKFSGNKHYADSLVRVDVLKNSSTESEYSYAWAAPDGATISSGDILDLYALIHECTHTLQYVQSEWHHCTWAMEGISTYTTYKTQKYIQKYYPNLIEMVGPTDNSLGNYDISNYSKLYKHSMEYWMTHTFKYSGNENYSIGFRLMWYLDEVYGDYTKWIYRAEKNNPFYKSSQNHNTIKNTDTLKAFYDVYGKDVFDDFYAWLKKKESLFEMKGKTIDISHAEQINLYPYGYDDGPKFYLSVATWAPIKYDNLYIGLEAGYQYLKDYKKKKNTSNLSLEVDEGVVVKFYDSKGKLLRTKTSIGTKMSLKGVSFVRLDGKGSLRKFEITGYK